MYSLIVVQIVPQTDLLGQVADLPYMMYNLATLIVWFGFGLSARMLLCALIIVFPVLINTIVGLRSVSQDLKDLMGSLQGSRWQTFCYLEVPAAMPVLLGGL